MAATPEGNVKKKVRDILKKYPHWGFWPVQHGYGGRALDYIGVINSRFFAIETKRAKKDLTDLQGRCKEQMEWHGGRVFVIIGENELQLAVLNRWLLSQNTLAEVGRKQ